MDANNSIKGVNHNYLLQDPPFLANPNNYNDRADFKRSFSKQTPLIYPTSFANREETLHQNIDKKSVLREEIYEYNVIIDSNDRDKKRFPNPFDFRVTIDPSVIGSDPVFEVDRYGRVVMDPITKHPVILSENKVSAPGPIIKPQIRNVKYAKFALAVLPKAFTMDKENVLVDNVRDSNLLVLDNDRFLVLDIKELRDPTKYSTNDSLTSAFAVMCDNDLSNRFHYTAYSTTAQTTFKNPLKKLDTLNVQIRGSDGKVLNYPYLKYCKCCDSNKCTNSCCNKNKPNPNSKKEEIISPIKLSSSLTFVNNIFFPFFGSFTGGTFTDLSDYKNNIDWELTGGVLQPTAQTIDFKFIGVLEKHHINGTLTVTELPNIYTFVVKVKFTKNEFEAYINGEIAGSPVILTVKGSWAKNGSLVFVLYGMLSGIYISIPISVNIFNLSNTPVISSIMQNQIIGSVETDLSLKNTITDSTSILPTLQKFKTKFEVCLNNTKNPPQMKTTLSVEGTFDKLKNILNIQLHGFLDEMKVHGSGSIALITSTTGISVSGTISIIYGQPNNLLSVLVTGTLTGTTVSGTLSGLINNIAYTWNFAIGYDPTLDSFQVFVDGSLSGNPFNVGLSFSLNAGCVEKEYCPQGFINGDLFISGIDTTMTGSFHHNNYLPQKYSDTFVISLFDTTTKALLFNVSGAINQTIDFKYADYNQNIIQNIISSGSFTGNVLLASPATAVPFAGVLSAEVDLELNNFVIVVNSPNISLIIAGELPNNFLNSGGGGQTIVTGNIIGTIQNNTPAIIATLNGTITGTLTGNVLIVTVNNTDGTSLTLSFNTGAPLNKDLKKDKIDKKKKVNTPCCDCCISCNDPRLQTFIVLTLGLLEPDINLLTPLLR